MLIAVADFCKPGSKNIKGTVIFTQINNKFVRVDISLSNVPIGIHGIHVHENYINFKLKNTNWCDIAGAHFNGKNKSWKPTTPTGTPHGSFLHNTYRHIGDMCNNIISEDGNVNMSYNDYLISLIPSNENCIIGRSVIIHENQDDEGMYMGDPLKVTQSKITGNAGARIACANIDLVFV
jgi:Cu/Zn superoxide dismutase